MEKEDSGCCNGERRFSWLLWRKKIQLVVMEKEDSGGCY